MSAVLTPVREVYKALVRKFQADKTVVDKGRKLYVGLGEKIKTPPYVNVVRSESNFDNDAFDAVVEDIFLDFTVYTGTGREDKAAEIVEELRRVFHEEDLVSTAFHTISIWQKGVQGPDLTDATYQARTTFELLAQWK